MGTWSVVKPHYHNFFWGKNTEERVSFIATTTELQAKADDKNSLKVSHAVNPIPCSYTGWKSLVGFFFLTGFAHYHSTLFLFITALNHLTKNDSHGVGSVFNKNHSERINSYIPVLHLAYGYP